MKVNLVGCLVVVAVALWLLAMTVWCVKEILAFLNM